MADRDDKRTGLRLEPKPDTGSFVDTVKGTVKYGRQSASGNSQADNNMVSANSTLKNRKYPRASGSN